MILPNRTEALVSLLHAIAGPVKTERRYNTLLVVNI